jgi:hypothetical protein
MASQVQVADRTDMRQFEGALDEKWCQLGRRGGVRFCGYDGPWLPPHGDGNPVVDGRCVGCGHLKCPDCLRLWREMRS